MRDADDLNEDDLGDDEDAQKNKYLTFQLGEEDYGIGIAHVTEIIGLQKITAVPDMPAFVKGVINLRGRVIPVIDVRLRFKMPHRDYDERTCVVVVSIQDATIGLLVDTVQEVATIPADHIAPPPQTGRKASQQFIQGMGKIGDEVKILLNAEKLLQDEELQEITNAAR